MLAESKGSTLAALSFKNSRSIMTKSENVVRLAWLRGKFDFVERMIFEETGLLDVKEFLDEVLKYSCFENETVVRLAKAEPGRMAEALFQHERYEIIELVVDHLLETAGSKRELGKMLELSARYGRYDLVDKIIATGSVSAQYISLTELIKLLLPRQLEPFIDGLARVDQGRVARNDFVELVGWLADFELEILTKPKYDAYLWVHMDELMIYQELGQRGLKQAQQAWAARHGITEILLQYKTSPHEVKHHMEAAVRHADYATFGELWDYGYRPTEFGLELAQKDPRLSKFMLEYTRGPPIVRYTAPAKIIPYQRR
jgi:hypothetical protein